MKFNFLAVFADLVFSLTLIFQTAEAQTAKKFPAKDAFNSKAVNKIKTDKL